MAKDSSVHMNVVGAGYGMRWWIGITFFLPKHRLNVCIYYILVWAYKIILCGVEWYIICYGTSMLWHSTIFWLAFVGKVFCERVVPCAICGLSKLLTRMLLWCGCSVFIWCGRHISGESAWAIPFTILSYA